MNLLVAPAVQQRARADEARAREDPLDDATSGIGVHLWQATMHDGLNGDAARQPDQAQCSEAHDRPVLP